VGGHLAPHHRRPAPRHRTRDRLTPAHARVRSRPGADVRLLQALWQRARVKLEAERPTSMALHSTASPQRLHGTRAHRMAWAIGMEERRNRSVVSRRCAALQVADLRPAGM